MAPLTCGSAINRLLSSRKARASAIGLRVFLSRETTRERLPTKDTALALLFSRVASWQIELCRIGGVRKIAVVRQVVAVVTLTCAE
jgi:hypothetical protein